MGGEEIQMAIGKQGLTEYKRITARKGDKNTNNLMKAKGHKLQKDNHLNGVVKKYKQP